MVSLYKNLCNYIVYIEEIYNLPDPATLYEKKSACLTVACPWCAVISLSAKRQADGDFFLAFWFRICRTADSIYIQSDPRIIHRNPRYLYCTELFTHHVDIGRADCQWWADYRTCHPYYHGCKHRHKHHQHHRVFRAHHQKRGVSAGI